MFIFIGKRELLVAICVAAVMIVGGVLLGHENNQVVPLNSYKPALYTQKPSNFLDFMSNWDGPDYITIAQHGYVNANQTNFSPLYPLGIFLVNKVVNSDLYSALMISWVFLVGAIFFYIKIIKQLFKVTDNLEALRGVIFFILFPSGVFLIATYTESLFAFFALGAIYSALNRRYLWSGLFLFLASLTHINAVFVIVLVGLILLEQKEKFHKAIAAMAIGAFGLLSYMAYLQIKFNNAFAFIDAQKQHAWLHYSSHNLSSTLSWVNLLFILLIIISAVYWWSRRKSFSIYSLLFLTIPLIGGQFGGFNRYVLMNFPIQLMLYDHFRNRKFGYMVCLSTTAILWAYFLFQYAGGYIGG